MAIFDVFTSYHDGTCSFMDQEKDNVASKSLSLSTDMNRPGLNLGIIIGWVT